MSFIKDLAYKLGLTSSEKYLLESIPKYKLQELYSSIDKLNNLEFVSNPEAAVRERNLVEKNFKKIIKDVLKDKKMIPAEATTKGYPLINTSTSILGYEPAGSILRKLYPNPFSVYAFIGENYWAARIARHQVRTEIERDGYVITSPSGSNKRKIKLVYTALKDLKIPELRVNCIDQLNVFGNCWIDRDTNLLGGITGISMLIPEKILPVLNTYGDIVEGWEYIWGNKRLYFPLGAIDHLKTYSLRSQYIASPPLAPIVVDVEADMQASVYTNTLFQKGGLVKALVSLDEMKDPNIINENTYFTFSEKLQNLFNRQYAGVRGGGQLMFVPQVRAVHKLGDPKDLEGPYAETSARTGAKVAMLLGVQPGRLYLPAKSQYENKMQTEDSGTLAFDNNIFYLASIVDEYINKKIIQDYLGIDDVEIQMSGEYGSVSINAANFGLLVSQIGSNIMTVNEFRTRVLRWEPLEDEKAGDAWLGDIKNKALLEKATQAPTAKEVEKYLQQVVGEKKLKTTKNWERHYPDDIRSY
jgi:hypothetical protein